MYASKQALAAQPCPGGNKASRPFMLLQLHYSGTVSEAQTLHRTQEFCLSESHLIAMEAGSGTGRRVLLSATPLLLQHTSFGMKALLFLP